jgi:hypothetical protein
VGDGELRVLKLELWGAIAGVCLVLTLKLLEEGIVICTWKAV